MTATYRTHNVAKAWLENVYGLMAIQKFVAEGANLDSGPLTVVSHSITLDPMYLEKMSRIHGEIADKGMFNHDPWGYFRISLDEKEIVVKHYSPDGIMLDEYRGKNPLAIRRKLYRNCAISDINHAMYIGVELQKAWQCLQSGAPYTQDA